MTEKLLIFLFYIKAKYFSSFKSREQLEKYQQKKIAENMKYISAKSPFFKKELQAGNIITNKKIMMDNFDSYNTAGITLKQALASAQKAEDSRDFAPMIGKYSVGLSSGTSGNRGVFLVSPTERAAWCGIILAKVIPHTIFKKTKIAFFLRANNTLYESVNSLTLKFKFFDLKNDSKANINELNSFQPDILLAPPSMLSLIADSVKNGEINVEPIKIISVADVLYPDIKEKLESIFNQPIHQIYQATEGFLGCTCKYGNMHINEDIVHIRKKYIGKDKKRFIPIITDFCRKAQPIVNYELNDILMEDSEPCPCGSNFIRLSAIEGRSDDILRFSDSTDKDVIIFPDFIVRAILKAVPSIEDFKVAQTSGNNMDIYSASDDKDRRKIKEAIETIFEGKNLNKIQISFKEMLYEKDLSVKRKRVENLWKK